MPRPEASLDRATGPLAEFALSLRELRVAAGMPTYRTLSKRAGYSPSTLSEAASGLRRPSLDVLLAYVGACGGDAQIWQQKWLSLPATTPPSAAGIFVHRVANAKPSPVSLDADSCAADLSKADPIDTRPTLVTLSPETPDPPRPRSAGKTPRWRWPRRLAALGTGLAVGASITIATVTVVLAQKPDCSHPSSDISTAILVGHGELAKLWDTASPEGQGGAVGSCPVRVISYCLGTMELNVENKKPDERWYYVRDADNHTGYLSAAVMSAPAGTREVPYVPCTGGDPMPTNMTFEIGRRASNAGVGGPSHAFDGRADNAPVIGYAEYVPGNRENGGRPWRQITLSDAAMGPVLWNPPEANDSSKVIAAACLGPGSPVAGVSAMRSIDGTRNVLIPRTSQSRYQPGEGEAEACS